MATTDNPLDRILVTGEQRLDGAILPVSNPAIDTEPLRFPSHPVTETNALYAAFDKDRHGNDHLTSVELENRLINHQAVALAGQQLLDGSVLGGAEDILHLHCLDDRQFLPRLHGIADRDGKPDQ